MKPRLIWTLSAFPFLWSTPVAADAGLPMIMVSMPGMIVALIPIILIEGFIIRRGFQIDWSEALSASAMANFLSTLVGIPVAWLLMVVVEIGFSIGFGFDFDNEYPPLEVFLSATLGAAWFYPWESWQVPTAQMVLLVPFFFVTWWIETRVLAQVCSQDFAIARRVCLRANLISYAVLAVITLGGLVWTLIPDVSRAEFEALQTEYRNELEALPKILSAAQSGAPLPLFKGNMDQSDGLQFSEVQGAFDCGKFYHFKLRGYPLYGATKSGNTGSLNCGYSGSSLVWPYAPQPRQTEYGRLYAVTGDDPTRVLYVFTLDQATEDSRFWIQAVLELPPRP